MRKPRSDKGVKQGPNIRTRRYFIVGPRSDACRLHRAEDRMDGSLTFCGRPIRAGWLWWLGYRNAPKNRAVCAGCV